jgi:deoxyribodipyrimidine photo-lyase
MLYNNGLFIFRRDFRIIDNTALNIANANCKNIYTIFIFTPEQVSKSNPYKSDNSVQFMIESLHQLSEEIQKKGGRLYTFYGDNNHIIQYCIKAFDINCIFFNKDYSPYAISRDMSIMNLSKELNIPVETADDYYLHPPGTIFNVSGHSYQKFTPYYNVAIKTKFRLPLPYQKIKFQKKNGSLKTITLEEAFHKFTKYNDDILVHGGRKDAFIKLKEAIKTQKNYEITRNVLSKQTTQLSAYIKFGCISIREVYSEFKHNKYLCRQLIWRDFYANILYSFPRVLKGPMKESYNKMKWHKNSHYLDAWKNGETGFPIVDAAMTELNKTGYMQNRGRLIVASFLVKTLLIHWKEGEKYFASKLTDYDPASNNGNWQWISGTGVDSQPFFRIFNPWNQSTEYDPNAEYIKKWITSLNDIPANVIHNWNRYYKDYKNINYPKPIVDYLEQKTKALEMYHSIFH